MLSARNSEAPKLRLSFPLAESLVEEPVDEGVSTEDVSLAKGADHETSTVDFSVEESPQKSRTSASPAISIGRAKSMSANSPKKLSSFDTSSEWIRSACPKVLAQIPPKNKTRYASSSLGRVTVTAKPETTTTSTGVQTDSSLTPPVGDLEHEVERLRVVCQQLSERLVDEVETRSEIEHGNTMLVSESERLTSELFSEAQNMVVQERRLRVESENKASTLERRLQEYVDIAASDKAEIQMLKCLIQDSHENKSRSKTLRLAEEETFPETDSSGATPEPLDETNTTIKLSGIAKRAICVYGESLESSYSPVQAKLARSFLHAGILQYHPSNPDYQEIVEICRGNNFSEVYNSKFAKRLISEEANPCIQFDSPHLGMIFKYKLARAIKSNQVALQKLTGQSIQKIPVSGRTCFLTDLLTLSNHHGTCYLFWLEEDTASKSSSTNAQSLIGSSAQNSFYSAMRSSFGSLLFSNGPPQLTGPEPVSTATSSLNGSSPRQIADEVSTVSVESSAAYDASSASSSPVPRYISQFARDRLVAACDFYKFLNMLQHGHLSTATPESIYVRLLALTERLFFAKLGLLPETDPLSLF